MNNRPDVARWSAGPLIVLSIMLVHPAIFADEIVADDLIIDGSACIGDGCVPDMEFGFSTIQLQGETPRLRIDSDGVDDWEIVANGPTAGNFLGFVHNDGNSRTIIFRIKAGAPAGSLLVDAKGRLGVGTGSPSRKLHVKGEARIVGSLSVREIEQTSSRYRKHDIESLSPADALAAVIDLRPVSYQLTEQPDEPTLGFIAEQVPDLLASTGRESIDSMKIVAALTGAIQAQGEAIEVRRGEIADLELRFSRLEQAYEARARSAAR